MGINISNFLFSKSKNRQMSEFQDLDHLDGLSISTVSANLYNSERDDLVMFYFREGANFASVYTRSKIISENIKWNLNQKSKKIFSLVINTRNANSFTGEQGYKSMQSIAKIVSVRVNNSHASTAAALNFRLASITGLGVNCNGVSNSHGNCSVDLV